MRRLLGLALLVVLVSVLVVLWAGFARYSQVVFGFRNGDGNSPEYLFFSGAGGILLGNVLQPALIVGVIIYYRKNNCKVQLCPRLGHHEFKDPVDGVSRLLCWKHHPDVRLKAVTPEWITKVQRKRHLYLGGKPGKG